MKKVLSWQSRKEQQREEEATVTEWAVTNTTKGDATQAVAPVTIRMVSSGFGQIAPASAKRTSGLNMRMAA